MLNLFTLEKRKDVILLIKNVKITEHKAINTVKNLDKKAAIFKTQLFLRVIQIHFLIAVLIIILIVMQYVQNKVICLEYLQLQKLVLIQDVFRVILHVLVILRQTIILDAIMQK
jgi:hypothetical protein